MTIGKSLNLKKQKMTKDQQRFLDSRRSSERISFIVIIVIRKVQLHVSREESFLIFKIYIID